MFSLFLVWIFVFSMGVVLLSHEDKLYADDLVVPSWVFVLCFLQVLDVLVG